jgi:hypothetical protein
LPSPPASPPPAPRPVRRDVRPPQIVFKCRDLQDCFYLVTELKTLPGSHRYEINNSVLSIIFPRTVVGLFSFGLCYERIYCQRLTAPVDTTVTVLGPRGNPLVILEYGQTTLTTWFTKFTEAEEAAFILALAKPLLDQDNILYNRLLSEERSVERTENRRSLRRKNILNLLIKFVEIIQEHTSANLYISN